MADWKAEWVAGQTKYEMIMPLYILFWKFFSFITAKGAALFVNFIFICPQFNCPTFHSGENIIFKIWLRTAIWLIRIYHQRKFSWNFIQISMKTWGANHAYIFMHKSCSPVDIVFYTEKQTFQKYETETLGKYFLSLKSQV